MVKSTSKKTARKTSKKVVRKAAVRKTAVKRVSSVHPLHRHVHNRTSLMALFVALSVFFFSYNSAVQAERAAASMTEQVQVIVMP